MAGKRTPVLSDSEVTSPIDLMRDMDAHLRSCGIDPARYPWYGGLTPARGYERPPARKLAADVVARWGRTA